MLRSVVFACACATAFGQARPVISLSLDSAATTKKLPHTVLRIHDLGITQPDGTSVGSRQDYVQRCQVAKDGSDCPLPSANAFDHQDGKLKVTARVIQIDADGVAMKKELKSFKQITYNKRSTYHLNYDASDTSGNHAEQIVFGLVIDDTTKPVVKPCVVGIENVEAASPWKLCASTTAVDNVDGNVASTLKYTVSYAGKKICPKCSYVKAAASISTLKLGTYTITAYAHDNARRYGHAGQNNFAKKVFKVVVKDTLPPAISPIGANPATHECATVYSDEGAVAKDKYDNKMGKVVKVVSKDNVNVKTLKKDYSVTYNAKDSTGNPAPQRTRTVAVVDTTKPKIWLKGGRRVEHVSETAFSDPGVNCIDTCTTHTIKPPVWKTPFTDTTLADYVRVYTCVDTVGNKASVRRTFTVVDMKAPILELVGKATMTVEAGDTYKEPGAKCHDYVDKDLTPKIVYSGKVNGGKVGVYTITYNCADESGNAAPFIQRRVFVKDRVCPTIKIKGAAAVTIEAGFAYKDDGAKAVDSFDGDLTSKITTDGDTVDTNKAFLAKRSCNEIKQNFKEATSGRYFITTKGGKRHSVWCDMSSKKAGTFMPCDKCKRVVPYGSTQGDCGKFGMKMADFASKAHKHVVAKAVKSHFTEMKEEESKYFPTNPKATTNYYVCVLRVEPKFKVDHTVKHEDIARAEQGKYVINYHVQDAAGNTECATASRVVVVRDTLAPVISLLYKGENIHNSGPKNKGVNGEYNPAATAAGNPYIGEVGLQEEQSASGSSLLSFAAVSFGVGVAMLAFSGNNGKATTVPV
jgi:hypothetical protein